MKKLLFIFFVIISYNYSPAQKLKDIYLQLSNYDGIPREDKEMMISNFLTGKEVADKEVGDRNIYLYDYQPKNGYLSYGGSYEGFSSVVYWNLSNGGQLVANYSQSCGPVCDVRLEFFIRNKKSLIRQKLFNVLPTITIRDFIDIDKMISDGINVEDIIQSFYSYDLDFILPQKGKNLIVESQYNELGLPAEYEKYSLTWRIELIWNDGTFLKPKKNEL
ncbi:hypothetical protein OO013_17190 [Mangrovivirga sp. M17]|uniref:DUF4163 domain-containing protein n=1 Tax=Mangrovivirga halotolerans TaxID=2993936 RepID=A0ABT3RVG1_9BACT|nr:hypothetical protein [Mangrovivirga halotolerans]MCX2745620.1 hypothetical protein [Mangrovivirga halotolerans]